MTYKIKIENEKTSNTIEVIDNTTSLEIVVRGEMCWYSNGTIFTIESDDGRIEKYMKQYKDDSVSGYTELIKL